MSTGRVVVVGGGLAGLAAATRLATAGSAVTLLEARPRLGGATHSFRRGGLAVDNGQHVFLRCYTAYREFLRSIRADDLVTIQRRLDIPVLTEAAATERGRTARIFRTRALPAPLHLSAALARYHHVPLAERMRIVRAALRLRRLDLCDPALDDRSFGAWLVEQRQGTASVEALWNLLTVAALNSTVDHASLLLAAKVFQTALLTDASAADIGLPLVPLDELHAGPAHRELTRRGADVRLQTKVTAIRPAEDGFEVAGPGGSLHADAVVLAVPHQQASGLLPAGALADPASLHLLSAAPIVNVHLVFDRPVMGLPFAAAVGSPLQWTFDRTRIAGLPPGSGQYLAVSLSAADQYAGLATGELRGRLLPAVRRLFPAARQARLVDFFVTRERRATFRQAPGTAAVRPGARTGVAGLLIAGAWTATEWPDTMEGAVRSGYEAARLARAHLTERSQTGRSSTCPYDQRGNL